MKTLETTFIDKGLMPYQDGLSFQQDIRQSIIELKSQNINTSQQNVLIFCEHEPILTFGSSVKEGDLLIPKEQLSEVGMAYADIRRGGSVTFHGKGQIVGYPVLDLDNFKTDVRWYIKSIAEVIILTLNEYEIESYYDPDFPGVWIIEKNGIKKKICAVGVHLSRWVTNHGFAFNVNNSLEYYKYFIPCGIREQDRTVTTLRHETEKPIDMEEIKEKLLSNFSIVFSTELIINKNV